MDMERLSLSHGVQKIRKMTMKTTRLSHSIVTYHFWTDGPYSSRISPNALLIKIW